MFDVRIWGGPDVFVAFREPTAAELLGAVWPFVAAVAGAAAALRFFDAVVVEFGAGFAEKVEVPGISVSFRFEGPNAPAVAPPFFDAGAGDCRALVPGEDIESRSFAWDWPEDASRACCTSKSTSPLSSA